MCVTLIKDTYTERKSERIKTESQSSVTITISDYIIKWKNTNKNTGLFNTYLHQLYYKKVSMKIRI